MLADLGINGWQLIIQLIAFIVFIWLLWRFAVGPITNVLDQRQVRIQESMQAAERMQAELKDTQARNEQVLQEARREAQEIVGNSRTTSEQLLARARTEAAAQSDEFLERARVTLRQETDRAKQQLHDEVGDLAVRAAGKIVREELDQAKHSRLILETLAEAAERPSPNQA